MGAGGQRSPCVTASRDPNPAPSARRVSRTRSPSKEVLPKRKGLPQNRCYQATHRNGAPVTELARREYAAVMRARYQHADRRTRGRLLDEYCRTTSCHRKAAIRRLRHAAAAQFHVDAIGGGPINERTCA